MLVTIAGHLDAKRKTSQGNTHADERAVVASTSNAIAFSICPLTSAGPYARNELNPISGSPINDGPSWSMSRGPGAITVNPSSVGATPACWTCFPSKWLMKVDFPEEWLPKRNTNGSGVRLSDPFSRGPKRFSFMGKTTSRNKVSVSCCTIEAISRASWTGATGSPARRVKNPSPSESGRLNTVDGPTDERKLVANARRRERIIR
jgi:hypothetical protein